MCILCVLGGVYWISTYVNDCRLFGSQRVGTRVSWPVWKVCVRVCLQGNVRVSYCLFFDLLRFVSMQTDDVPTTVDCCIVVA